MFKYLDQYIHGYGNPKNPASAAEIGDAVAILQDARRTLHRIPDAVAILRRIRFGEDTSTYVDGDGEHKATPDIEYLCKEVDEYLRYPPPIFDEIHVACVKAIARPIGKRKPPTKKVPPVLQWAIDGEYVDNAGIHRKRDLTVTASLALAAHDYEFGYDRLDAVNEYLWPIAKRVFRISDQRSLVHELWRVAVMRWADEHLIAWFGDRQISPGKLNAEQAKSLLQKVYAVTTAELGNMASKLPSGWKDQDAEDINAAAMHLATKTLALTSKSTGMNVWGYVREIAQYFRIGIPRERAQLPSMGKVDVRRRQ